MTSLDTYPYAPIIPVHLAKPRRRSYKDAPRKRRRWSSLLIALGLASSAATLTSVEPVAAASASISGTITNASGGAAAFARVFATTLDGRMSFTGTADATGRYTLQVEPTFYCVSFGPIGTVVASSTYRGVRHCLDGASAVNAGSGATVTGIDGVLHVADLAGVVRGPTGLPAVGATVNAYQVAGSASASAQTAADGGYVLLDLPPGSYCLFAGNNSGAATTGGQPGCAEGGRRIEMLVDTPLAGIDLVLASVAARASISGKVTFGGAALANRTVLASALDGVSSGSATTAADGSYTIGGLAAGSYCVRALIQPGSPAGAEAYANAEGCGTATPVDVSTSAVSGIDLQLDQGGTIQGTVTSATAAPLPTADIALRSFGVASQYAWTANVRSAPNGTYAITGVPAGDYCITFADPDRKHAPEAFPDASSCTSGALPVRVTRGAATVVDAQLGDGGTIVGTVSVPSGQLAGGMIVTATGSMSTVGLTTTDASGNYTISHVTPGKYCTTVYGSSSSDLADQVTNSTAPTCTAESGTLIVGEGATVRADATMQLGGSVSGWVVTSAGHPIYDAGVAVRPLAGGPEVGHRALDRGDGSFSVRGVSPGVYCIEIGSAGQGIGTTVLGNVASCDASEAVSVTVTSGLNVGNLKITPRRVGYVRGTVRAVDGRNAEGARVDIFPAGSTTPVATYVVGRADRLATDRTSFAYEVEAAPGSYCVRVLPPAGSGLLPRAYATGSDCGQGSTPVVVKESEYTTGVDVTLLLNPALPGGPGPGGPGGGGAGGGTGGPVGADGKPLLFVPLPAPGRLTDTRPGRDTIDGADAGAGRVEAAATHEVLVAGRAGVPANAASVVLNVTAVDASAAGFATVWPCGVDRPLASNVNFERGDTRPNSVIAKVGVDGKVCVFSSQAIDAVVDVAGYFPTTEGFTPLGAPGRLTDTRAGSATVDGVDAGSGAISGDGVHEVKVAGRAGVPAGAASVVLNVTAVDAGGAGFATVYPCGVPRPLASNVNFVAGATVPNSVIARVGTDGKVCVYSSQKVDAVVDVAGYFPGTDGFLPLDEPRRVLDTRTGFATVDGVDAGGGAVAADAVHEVTVAGRAGVPGSAASVVLNVTAVDASAAGFATVFPCGVPRPLASNVNFVAGATVPNSVLAKVGADGKVCIYSSQKIDAVIDIAGYFP